MWSLEKVFHNQLESNFKARLGGGGKGSLFQQYKQRKEKGVSKESFYLNICQTFLSLNFTWNLILNINVCFIRTAYDKNVHPP